MRKMILPVFGLLVLSLSFKCFCGEPQGLKKPQDANSVSKSSYFADILKKAEQGDAEAQYQIGKRYSAIGQDVKQDFKEAVKWFSKAAEQGYADAQSILGFMYLFGVGVEQNSKEAIKWYTRAAEQGHAEAQCHLGSMYFGGINGVERNSKEAIKWCTKAAEQGNAKAQYYLALRYSNGSGVKQDKNEAVKWYTKAAEQGHATAQYNLGLIYYDGKGVIQDHKEAFKWFAKSAEQGDASAQFNLGVMYYNGEGVTQDHKEAFKWFTKAAEQGNSDAQFNLGSMCSNGEGVKQDPKEAVKWYTKAAEQGNSNAQFNLGGMYGCGEGVIEDYIEAYKWLLLAGMNGKDVSQQKVYLQNRMALEQIALAQQKAKEFVATRENTSKKDKESISSGLTVSGTGFFISKEGYLLTASHVVQNAATIQVFWQGKTLLAQKVFSDKEHDLAVLKVQGTDSFPALPLLGSSEVKTGDAIFTLGFPQIQIQGAEPKYTDGSISALTGIGNNPKYFQISVPVQPGNSGGPLLDNKGHVIGIVVSRLNDMQMLLETGSVPQNVNYALKGSFVLSLLESVSDISGKLEKPVDMNKAEAIERAKKAVAIVICTLQ
jgi:TPR repeat protein